MESHQKFEKLSLSRKRKRLHIMHNFSHVVNNPNQYSENSDSCSEEERFENSSLLSPLHPASENQSEGSVDGSEDVPDGDSEIESSNQGLREEE